MPISQTLPPIEIKTLIVSIRESYLLHLRGNDLKALGVIDFLELDFGKCSLLPHLQKVMVIDVLPIGKSGLLGDPLHASVRLASFDHDGIGFGTKEDGVIYLYSRHLILELAQLVLLCGGLSETKIDRQRVLRESLF